ncbi:BTAD domain-containing putative transcriptional regulator [Frankia gtarii]|nr:BTAD domain-containing putative transcriptional regulator [Frankia gtarii]
MPPTVLPARVRPPAAAGVRRERLTGLFGASAPYRVGLVVAPAGAGKSTLLAEIARVAGCPAAWLTLDARIGDVGSFLAHLHAAVTAGATTTTGRSSTSSSSAPHDEAMIPERSGDLPWDGIENAIADLERRLGGDLLIVLDDLHTIDGQPAEYAVQTLLDYLPSRVRVLAAARWRPDLDLHRLRLAGQIRELDAESLRFRTWEVEELFRDCHGVRLRPDEVAALTRSTDGWAAGLQLFHLATRGRPPSERAKILSGLANTRLVRDYLTTHVLEAVRPEQRDFLIQTSVLDRLTERRCDSLLGRTGSATELAELERRGLFTFVEDDGRSYHYHEVLRVHLLERLVHELGETRANEVHRAAARLCEGEGVLREAVLCYCRCGDWDQVRRLLGQDGERLAEDPAGWFDLLPPSIRDSDPWVLLAMARRFTANGSLAAAANAYRDAAAAFGAQTPVRVAREQAALDDWLHPAPSRTMTWVGVLRAVLVDPAPHVEGPAETPQMALARGVAALVGGEIGLARRRFTLITSGIGASPSIETAAAIGRAACAVLMPETAVDETADEVVEAAMAAAELLGSPAVLRVAAGIQAMRLRAGRRHIVHLLDAAAIAGDRWGALVITLLGSCAALTLPDDTVEEVDEAPAGLRLDVPIRARRHVGPGGEVPSHRRAFQQVAVALEQTAGGFDELAAPALATWARCAGMLASRRAGTIPGEQEAAPILRAAARLGPAPHALALLASAPPRGVDPAAGGPCRPHPYETALRIAAESGIGEGIARLAELAGAQGSRSPGPGPSGLPAPSLPAADPGVPPSTADPGVPASVAGRAQASRLTVRCLGGFEMALDGKPVDLAGVQPRNLELLGILAVHAGRPVHRDRLTELIWPEAEPTRANHSLQVAISALRSLLEPDVPRDRRALLRRAGQGYLLALAHDDDHDIRRLERLLDAASRARGADDHPAESGYLTSAIGLYRGEVLPAGAPADWLLTERERLRTVLAAACERASRLLTEIGRHAEAVRHAERGLEIDRYRDGLWQTLVLALRRGGRPAAAAHAEVRYQWMLADLGIDSQESGGGPDAGDPRALPGGGDRQS